MVAAPNPANEEVSNSDINNQMLVEIANLNLRLWGEIYKLKFSKSLLATVFATQMIKS